MRTRQGRSRVGGGAPIRYVLNHNPHTNYNFSELAARVPDVKMDDLLKLLSIPTDSRVCFAEFWAIIEHTVSGESVDTDSDDIRCLRLLRDKILREVRLGPTGRCVPQRRLLSILREIHDTAQSKSMWDDAIKSASLDNASSKLHTLETLSLAIRTMLVDYLAEPSDDLSPHHHEKDQQLEQELDTLRSALTESECVRSQAVEDARRLKLELEQLRVQLTNTSPEDSIRISTLSEENRSLQSEVEERNTKIEKLTKELEETRTQLAKVKKQLSQMTSPLSIRLSSADPPSASEWKLVQIKIHSLLSKPSPETVSALQSIETLSSQVKTLEVLKNDADAEITRLKGELDGGTIDLKSMPASSSRRAPTVTIHKQTAHSLLREPSSEAVSFVESVGVKTRKTKRAASMRAGAPSGVGQCIQQ
jgi:hypothetical protein